MLLQIEAIKLIIGLQSVNHLILGFLQDCFEHHCSSI